MRLDPVYSQARLVLGQQLARALLAADPRVDERLQALAGHCIELNCDAPFGRHLLVLTEAGVELYGDADQGPVDLSLSGSVQQLRSLLQGAEPEGAGVRWSGSEALLEQLLQIFREAHWDFETLISARLSVIPRPWNELSGASLAQGALAGGRWLERNLGASRADLREYLQEELRLLPGRPALNSFKRELEQLQLRMAPLDERIDQLQQQQLQQNQQRQSARESVGD